MFGFIKKDLAMIKSNFKLLGVLLIVYIAMGFLGQMDISFILPFLSVMVMISTFSYDNYNKWDAYAVTLPDGRKNNVRSKYLVTILLIVVMAIATFLLTIMIGYVNKEPVNYSELLIHMLGTIFGTILVLAFMYPIIYKFGLEKARIGIFVAVFAIAILGTIIIQYCDLTFLGKTFDNLENYLITLLIFLTIGLPLISYFISLKIVKKKEY